MRFAGEFAALGTALCWAVGSNLFAAAGRRMGSGALNQLRIAVGAGFLCLALLVLRGSPWPVWATGEQVALLAVSGLIGFAFGDGFYFRSLVILGPGRASLVASLAPLFTVLIGWPVLGEAPGPVAAAGMALTLGGIFWVVRERGRAEHASIEGSVAVGVAAGVLGGLGQAAGYVISKLALRTGIDPLSATVVRIVAAMVGVWLLGAARGNVTRVLGAMRDRRAAGFMVGGAFMGPFLGVTLSLTALAFIQAGVAASITAIYPVFALLISARFHGEQITPRALAGTLVAVVGVIVLFLR